MVRRERSQQTENESGKTWSISGLSYRGTESVAQLVSPAQIWMEARVSSRYLHNKRETTVRRSHHWGKVYKLCDSPMLRSMKNTLLHPKQSPDSIVKTDFSASPCSCGRHEPAREAPSSISYSPGNWNRGADVSDSPFPDAR